jgi:hypothetical protein
MRVCQSKVQGLHSDWRRAAGQQEGTCKLCRAPTSDSPASCQRHPGLAPEALGGRCQRCDARIVQRPPSLQPTTHSAVASNAAPPTHTYSSQPTVTVSLRNEGMPHAFAGTPGLHACLQHSASTESPCSGMYTRHTHRHQAVQPPAPQVNHAVVGQGVGHVTPTPHQQWLRDGCHAQVGLGMRPCRVHTQAAGHSPSDVCGGQCVPPLDHCRPQLRLQRQEHRRQQRHDDSKLALAQLLLTLHNNL